MGRRMVAVLSTRVTMLRARLEISVSRKSHQDATTAARRGKHGPSGTSGVRVSGISRSLAKGSPDACRVGPLPRAAAREMRLKWMRMLSGRLP